MYWKDIVDDVRNGAKARRIKWKPGEYVRYSGSEKRYYHAKKHKEKPWYSKKDELTDVNDWSLM